MGMRMMMVTFKPGEEAAMHSHPEHMGYVLEGGKIKLSQTKEASRKPWT